MPLAKKLADSLLPNLSILELFMRKSILLALAATAFFSASAAQADSINLVKNGDFEQTTNGTSKQLGADGNTSANRTQLTDWSTQGYNFVFGANTADTTGSNGLTLWGPNSYNGNGPQNGLTKDRKSVV